MSNYQQPEDSLTDGTVIKWAKPVPMGEFRKNLKAHLLEADDNSGILYIKNHRKPVACVIPYGKFQIIMQGFKSWSDKE